MSDKTLSASAAGASYLILLQVLSRALTFALNQILLRFLNPELLGVSAQLELYSISVLYFARESIRVAVQRHSQDVQTVVNLSYLAVAAGVPLAWGFAWLYLRSEVPKVPYFELSLSIYAASALVELLSEPAFVVAQQKLLYKIRASAEGTATIAKCFVTVGFTIWASRWGGDVGVLPFAFGQAAFAGVLLLVYTLRVLSSTASANYSLLPSKLSSERPEEVQPYLGFFSKPLTDLSISLTLQSTLKFFLTQSDGLIVATYASLADQGAYALASNYGGLVARMLFQPIEEAGRTLFARLCATSRVTETDAVGQDGERRTNREEPKATDTTNLNQAASVLTTLLHLYSILSLLALSVGPHAAPLLLTVIAGRRWSLTSAPDVLATYCYYIPLLAYNGIIEAFVAAVATPADLKTQSIWTSAFSVAFAGTAYVFLSVYGWGARGVVLANCVNMGLRIGWGGVYIGRWFRARGIKFNVTHARPAVTSVAAAVAVYALLESIAVMQTESLWMQLGKAGAVAGCLGLSILFFERKFFAQCYRMLRPEK